MQSHGLMTVLLPIRCNLTKCLDRRHCKWLDVIYLPADNSAVVSLSYFCLKSFTTLPQLSQNEHLCNTLATVTDYCMTVACYFTSVPVSTVQQFQAITQTLLVIMQK